jgi:hypothetical protein
MEIGEQVIAVEERLEGQAQASQSVMALELRPVGKEEARLEVGLVGSVEEVVV